MIKEFDCYFKITSFSLDKVLSLFWSDRDSDLSSIQFLLVDHDLDFVADEGGGSVDFGVDIDGLDVYVDAVWVPRVVNGWVLMSVNKSWLLDAQIELNNSFKVAGLGVELHGFGSTLSGFDVGSGESLYFTCLESSIEVVETFGTGSSRSGQVFISFELPICPTGKVLVGDLSDLGDFGDAFVGIHAGTEFAHDERNSKSLGIFVSGANPLLMQVQASISISGRWLSCSSANVGSQLAAVGVIIENVIG